MNTVSFVVCTVAIMGGMMVFAYRDMARARGWMIGEAFLSDSPKWFSIMAGLDYAGAIIVTVTKNPWWTVIPVFVLGLMLGSFTTERLGPLSQIVGIALTVVGFVGLSIVSAF